MLSIELDGWLVSSTHKLYLSRSQFVMTKREEASKKQFAVFCVNVYVRTPFEETNAAAAPANDLEEAYIN